MLAGMEISAAGPVTGRSEPTVLAGAPAGVAGGSGERPFGATLDDQARRAAARDVMASMPPMLAYALTRTAPGEAPSDPSLQSVSALFEGIKRGEFTPSAEQRAARGSVIGATAQAADVFASAGELWSTVRELLGGGDAIAQAVRLAGGDAPMATGGELLDTTGGALLGGPIPAEQVHWWEAALLLLRPELAWGERDGSGRP